MIEVNPAYTGSESVVNGKLELFRIPPTDIRPDGSHRTGTTSIDFQVDAYNDFVDFNRRHF